MDTPSTENREAYMYNCGKPTAFRISILTQGQNVFAIEVHTISYRSASQVAQPSSVTPSPDWFIAPVSGFTSNLPIVIIDTHGQSIRKYVDIVASMRVVDKPNMQNRYSDSIFTYNGKIHLEHHGQSSYYNDWPKKIYNVELIAENCGH